MPLLLLTTAWIAGLVVAGFAPLLTVQWLILSGIAFVALLLSLESRVSRWAFGLLFMLCLGAARGSHAGSLQAASELAKYNDLPQRARLTGVISEFPEERERHTQFTLEVSEIAVGTGPPTTIEGSAMAQASRFEDWHYGDRVELYGRLETPPVFEDFSYRAYLARHGIHSLLRAERGVRLDSGHGNPVMAGIYRLRSKAKVMVSRLFPEPEASLLSGILLGLEGGISQSTRTSFDRTGTTHIIAISGFNITIIAGIFIVLGQRWLGAQRGSVIAGVAIIVYTVLVGADAAVLRASLMASLALVAQRLGRQTDGLAALAASALIMTAVDPSILEDIGFQLSFAATLGLLLYAQPLTDVVLNAAQTRLRVKRSTVDKLAGPFSEFFMVTLAAQITTLPLILFHFNRLSLISPIANLLILPAQPAVMVLAGVATIAGMLWLPLGRALAALAWPFASYTIEIVNWLAQWPGASLATSPTPIALIIAFYAALFTLTFLPASTANLELPRSSSRVPWPLLVGVLLIANVLAWRLVFDQPDGRTHLTLLETGDQPGILIQTTDGRRLLIDGGNSSIALGSQLDSRMSPLQRQLDWIILTEPNEDSAAGIAGLIERYQIGGALIVSPSSDATNRTISAKLAETNRPVGQFLHGQTMDLGDGAILKLHVLEGGAAYLLEHDRARYLLIVGQPKDWIEAVGIEYSDGLSALLLPGSGDAKLTAPDEVHALNPRVVMVAIAPGQGRGLPANSLVESLEGRPFLRTDHHGWIELITDGNQMWIEVARDLSDGPANAALLELDLFPWRSIFLRLD